MRLYSDGHWAGNFLPYSASFEGDVTIEVRRWLTLEPVDGLYFVRPRSVRMVINYARELGLREVWRKIRSRRAEGLRNRKFLAVGIGVERGRDGQTLAFVAPAHPDGVDQIVLPRHAVRALAIAAPSGLCHAYCAPPIAGIDGLRKVSGWSPFAGAADDPADWDRALDEAERLLAAQDWREGPVVEVEPDRAAVPALAAHGRGVLFGYGNYAKLYILPNVQDRVPIDRIHEVDPTQIPLDRAVRPQWSTSAQPLAHDHFDAWFIAGYHHTHAPLAIAALEQGAAAVVEKPVAMDQAQLDALLAAVDQGNGRFFAGYHKRYSPLTGQALADLGVAASGPAGCGDGSPIDYHCIVYEVPLPERHWYRWPNSHSRILSNGCHWLDHFLFLNGFAAPRSIAVNAAASGTINCSVELINGAFFTMALTEHGSERLGVRDYIELRRSDVTVSITDTSRYRAESSTREIRQLRLAKPVSYQTMYRTIANAIADGAPGDSRASIAISAQLIIDVERALLMTYGAPTQQRDEP